MADGTVLLTARHLNQGLRMDGDWGETRFTVFEDGTVTCVNHAGSEDREFMRSLNESDFAFIEEHIGEYMKAEPVLAICDGTTWEFKYRDRHFGPGYVYGIELEEIAEILDALDLPAGGTYDE